MYLSAIFYPQGISERYSGEGKRMVEMHQSTERMTLFTKVSLCIYQTQRLGMYVCVKAKNVKRKKSFTFQCKVIKITKTA